MDNHIYRSLITPLVLVTAGLVFRPVAFVALLYAVLNFWRGTRVLRQAKRVVIADVISGNCVQSAVTLNSGRAQAASYARAAGTNVTAFLVPMVVQVDLDSVLLVVGSLALVVAVAFLNVVSFRDVSVTVSKAFRTGKFRSKDERV